MMTPEDKKLQGQKRTVKKIKKLLLAALTERIVIDGTVINLTEEDVSFGKMYQGLSDDQPSRNVRVKTDDGELTVATIEPVRSWIGTTAEHFAIKVKNTGYGRKPNWRRFTSPVDEKKAKRIAKAVGEYLIHVRQAADDARKREEYQQKQKANEANSREIVTRLHNEFDLSAASQLGYGHAEVEPSKKDGNKVRVKIDLELTEALANDLLRHVAPYR